MRDEAVVGPTGWPDRLKTVAAQAAGELPRLAGVFRSFAVFMQPGRASALSTGVAFALIALLTLLRCILAARLPLSFDEAYYWLWSRHLALGYYEHPAAIALAIRAGAAMFGDTEWGVRFLPLVASVVASWAVWRSAAILLESERAGSIACLLFNAMLMTAAETMGATPDSVLIAAAAVLVWTAAKLQVARDGRWWIAVGATAGIALSIKYTALFLCMSLAFWLFLSPECRSWRRSFWPYAGAVVATAFFAPTLYWNATHGFMSFAFQFGRIGRFHTTLLHLPEYIGGQLALASPFILVLAGYGLAQNSRATAWRSRSSLAAAIVWPAAAYFLVHSLHDRVQGNWPCFVYPALALLAAQTYASPNASEGSFLRLSRRLALPSAFAILAVAYAQAFFGLFPIGRHDPLARMMGVGFAPIAQQANSDVKSLHADAIVTSNYDVTSWLAFYARPAVPIVQVAEEARFLSSPRATAPLLRGRLLYVTQAPERELPEIRTHFSTVSLLQSVARARNGHTIDKFEFYAVSGFHGPAVGRIP